MQIKNRKSICTELNKFCHLQKDHAYIEVTEWSSGEGYDIDLDGRHFRVTHGELTAINMLITMLDNGIEVK